MNISLAEDQVYKFKSKNTNFIGSVAKEKDGSKTISFVGIPFAKPPVDDLRWKAPRELDLMPDTFEAKTYLIDVCKLVIFMTQWTVLREVQ